MRSRLGLSGVLFLACSSTATTSAPTVPLQKGAPWPKFRANAAQTGASAIHPSKTGGSKWDFKTGKGIFSSPVVGADGTIYFGSADRTFYALNADGTLKWKIDTGEIIDSSGLLDDEGHIYFGSGDGKLRAADAQTGAIVWTMQADDPAKLNIGSFINWFEGNVAIGPKGTLYVPNDDFLVYAVNRETGAPDWTYRMPDQTWALPAVDAKTGTIYMANNNLLPVLGKNTFSVTPDGKTTNWAMVSLGTVAASPMMVNDLIVVGGFDGYLHAYAQSDGTERWSMATRDHIYASPALQPNGTIVQPSCDGTIYGVSAIDGAIKWTYDTNTPMRSSPAIDADGNVYVGGGDGRLYVLNADGTLRFAVKLIDDVRNDLNASPALSKDAILIGGESGQMFSVPYDWCLRPEAKNDATCSTTPTPSTDGATLDWINTFGDPVAIAPIDTNGRVTLALNVRASGAQKLAVLDSTAVTVTTTPQTDVSVEVSGDGKFVSITPKTAWQPGALALSVHAPYLVDFTRTGLRLSGGRSGGAADAKISTTVNAPAGGAAFDPKATYELLRLSVPLPTLMPSYNQIGFDSLHYWLAAVEPNVAWMIGAMLPEGQNTSVPDPSTKALFPLALSTNGDAATLQSAGALHVQIMSFSLPFQSFRVAARFGPNGDPLGHTEVAGSAVCGGIPFYGPFLQQLGLCNPQTDVIRMLGASNLQRRRDVVAPPNAGTPTFSLGSSTIDASIVGAQVKPSEHLVSLLAVDATTGQPINLDYAFGQTIKANPDGTLASLSVTTKGVTLPPTMRVYVMVDTTVGAKGTL